MNRPELPPILNTKEYKSLVEKYKQEEEKQRQYCYKPPYFTQLLTHKKDNRNGKLSTMVRKLLRK